MTDDPGSTQDLASQPLSQALREASRGSHDRIEAALDVGGRITTPESYTGLLAAFYGFYRPLEDALAALDWADTGLDLDERRKAGLLAADLAACDYDPAAVPLCPDVPRPADRAEGFG